MSSKLQQQSKQNLEPFEKVKHSMLEMAKKSNKQQYFAFQKLFQELEFICKKTPTQTKT